MQYALKWLSGDGVVLLVKTVLHDTSLHGGGSKQSPSVTTERGLWPLYGDGERYGRRIPRDGKEHQRILQQTVVAINNANMILLLIAAQVYTLNKVETAI